MKGDLKTDQTPLLHVKKKVRAWIGETGPVRRHKHDTNSVCSFFFQIIIWCVHWIGASTTRTMLNNEHLKRAPRLIRPVFDLLLAVEYTSPFVWCARCFVRAHRPGQQSVQLSQQRQQQQLSESDGKKLSNPFGWLALFRCAMFLCKSAVRLACVRMNGWANGVPREPKKGGRVPGTSAPRESRARWVLPAFRHRQWAAWLGPGAGRAAPASEEKSIRFDNVTRGHGLESTALLYNRPDGNCCPRCVNAAAAATHFS